MEPRELAGNAHARMCIWRQVCGMRWCHAGSDLVLWPLPTRSGDLSNLAGRVGAATQPPWSWETPTEQERGIVRHLRIFNDARKCIFDLSNVTHTQILTTGSLIVDLDPYWADADEEVSRLVLAHRQWA